MWFTSWLVILVQANQWLSIGAVVSKQKTRTELAPPKKRANNPDGSGGLTSKAGQLVDVFFSLKLGDSGEHD